MAAGVAQLAGGDAVVTGRVPDVVPEAVEQTIKVAGRVAGGVRAVLVGPGRFIGGREVLRGLGMGRLRGGLAGRL
jgi:hypothetical protein